MNEGWHAPWLDALAGTLSRPPLPGLWFAALAALVVRLRGRAGVWAVLLAAAAAGISDLVAAEVVKPWVDRLRPCFALPDVRLLLPRQPASPSFPSNHAANCFAVATVLASLGPGFARMGFILAAIVAVSRVYLGVHYPLDVVAGALLGVGVGAAVRALPGGLADARSRPGAKRPKTRA